MAMHALGIDIGGTGIKGAPVDVTTGKLLADRQKIETPRPSTPEAVAEVVKQLLTSFSWSGPIGITFPGVVTDGTIRTAANVDPSWIGVDAGQLFGQACGNQVTGTANFLLSAGLWSQSFTLRAVACYPIASQ